MLQPAWGKKKELESRVAYLQTGTAWGRSEFSRSLACHGARTHALTYSCRVDRFEQTLESCRCAAGDGAWRCIVDFKLWCY